jgi:transcriptional regulator with XRE-family HTH domain
MRIDERAVVLRVARRRSGLTLDDVAHRVGCSVGTVRNYERGITTPRIDVLIRLVRVLRVPLSDVIE